MQMSAHTVDVIPANYGGVKMSRALNVVVPVKIPPDTPHPGQFKVTVAS